jgi:hypothetical protein
MHCIFAVQNILQIYRNAKKQKSPDIEKELSVMAQTYRTQTYILSITITNTATVSQK